MRNARKGRRFKCKYCNESLEIADLIIHIDEEHDDLIPKDMTAAQVVYNTVNKRDRGSCLICKRETKWDEEKWRYDSLCGRQKCYDEYIARFRSNMKRTGKDDQMNNPEHQKKMLEGRKISGTYKFADGGVKSYVATYEKQLLEFLDKVCNINSKDLETPGPTIDYNYKGEKKFWITDLYYTPFNLVFDVKPGGDNKNTHPDMEENRQKQKAKQDQIIKDGVYNYIELTDNNFAQLFTILKEIKLNMFDNINDKVIKIYEDTQMGLKYLIPYSDNGYIITGYAASNSILMEDLFIEENGKMIRKDKSFLEDKSYTIYKGDLYDGTTSTILEAFGIELPSDINYLQKIYDNNGKYDLSDILKHEEFKNKNTNQIESLVESALLNEVNTKEEMTITNDYPDNDEPINESYIFNQKDLYINFDKFESGQSNMVFITGLSGGGKSTLATKLASKYNAEVIELDIFEHNAGYTDENLNQAGDVFVEYFLNKRKDLRVPIKKLANMDSKTFRMEFEKFFNFVIEYCKKNKDRKFIIEGVQIYSRDLKQIKGNPIILVNTSVKTSLLQRFKRNDFDGNKIDWKAELKNEFPQLISWYIDNEHEYSRFKKELLAEDVGHENFSTLYYLSAEKLDDDELIVHPSNHPPIYIHKNTYSAQKKILTSTSVEKLLRLVPTNFKNRIFHIYEPFYYPDIIYEIPSSNQYEDVQLTDVVWITNDCKMSYVGAILLKEPDLSEPMASSDHKVGVLYDWNWSWENKPNTSDLTNTIVENTNILDSIRKNVNTIPPVRLSESEEINTYQGLLEDFTQYSNIFIE
jgi:dephospho-CoA kinase